MKRTTLAIALCAVIGLSPLASIVAQEQLPASMAGRWIGMGGGGAKQGGKIPIDFAWSIKITKQNPDGSIEGTLSYGGPSCSAKDAPMTGTFNGKELKLTAQLQPPAQCGKQTFRMKKVGGTHLFEGESPGRKGYLDPN